MAFEATVTDAAAVAAAIAVSTGGGGVCDWRLGDLRKSSRRE